MEKDKRKLISRKAVLEKALQKDAEQQIETIKSQQVESYTKKRISKWERENEQRRLQAAEENRLRDPMDDKTFITLFYGNPSVSPEQKLAIAQEDIRRERAYVVFEFKRQQRQQSLTPEFQEMGRKIKKRIQQYDTFFRKVNRSQN